tara:strand:- start:1149 stop:1430 length:282 start_codon:yes stop_codon:yes gene_type:complete
MKKITISVATLLIAMNSFSQSNDSILISKIGEDKFNLLQKIEIENTAEDMIEWINYDVENGKIYPEYAVGYIENLQEIVMRIRKLRENEYFTD